jgi:hypothetical protein
MAAAINGSGSKQKFEVKVVYGQGTSHINGDKRIGKETFK